MIYIAIAYTRFTKYTSTPSQVDYDENLQDNAEDEDVYDICDEKEYSNISNNLCRI